METKKGVAKGFQLHQSALKNIERLICAFLTDKFSNIGYRSNGGYLRINYKPWLFCCNCQFVTFFMSWLDEFYISFSSGQKILHQTSSLFRSSTNLSFCLFIRLVLFDSVIQFYNFLIVQFGVCPVDSILMAFWKNPFGWTTIKNWSKEIGTIKYYSWN